MRQLFFIILLLLPFLSIAQQDTIQTEDFEYAFKHPEKLKNSHYIYIDPKSHKTRSEGDYLNDKQNGLWLTYNDNGTVSSQRSYKNCVKDGIWFDHHNNGFFARKEKFLDGKLVEGHCYNEQGEEIPYFSQPFTYVEQMPKATFDLENYIRENLKYPKAARKAGIHGSVVVRFIVKEDGTIFNASVVKGIDSASDAEALRLVKNMPPWKPGKQDGKNVSVNYNVPVHFQL